MLCARHHVLIFPLECVHAPLCVCVGIKKETHTRLGLVEKCRSKDIRMENVCLNMKTSRDCCPQRLINFCGGNRPSLDKYQSRFGEGESIGANQTLVVWVGGWFRIFDGTVVGRSIGKTREKCVGSGYLARSQATEESFSATRDVRRTIQDINLLLIDAILFADVFARVERRLVLRRLLAAFRFARPTHPIRRVARL